MGMYTELVMAVELEYELDENTLNILNYMLRAIEEGRPVNLPEHELFKTDSWEFMLFSDSYYFSGKTDSKLIIDDISGYILQIRCNVKNYDSEIEKFIDWISQYVPKHEKDLAGYFRYEEDVFPSLIYFNQVNENE